jgi:hypothetical protein
LPQLKIICKPGLLTLLDGLQKITERAIEKPHKVRRGDEVVSEE